MGGGGPVECGNGGRGGRDRRGCGDGISNIGQEIVSQFDIFGKSSGCHAAGTFVHR